MKFRSALITLALIALMGATSPTTTPSDDYSAGGQQQNSTSAGADRQRGGGRRSRRSRRNAGPAILAAATSDPSDTFPQPGPISDEFALFDQRSMFLPSNGEIPTARSTRLNAGETELVLCGVSITDKETVAFIEDTTNSQVSRVRVGEQIAKGKVGGISLDRMNYTATDGRKVTVNVGENLQGQNAWGEVYGLGSDVVPANADQGVDSGTAAILAKLRQKRMQELNGGGSATTPTPAPTPSN